MAVERRPCDKCGKNRDVKFFTRDARRLDQTSTRCNTCKRKRRQVGTRDQRLQETYGITGAEFQAILAAQGGVCAICKGRRPSYDCDHSHAGVKAGVDVRMTVRGALCRRCNRRLLPASTESIAVLERAIEYLRHPPAFAVIGPSDPSVLAVPISPPSASQ